MKKVYRSELYLIVFHVTPVTDTNRRQQFWPNPDKFFLNGQSTIKVAMTAPSPEEAKELLQSEYKQWREGYEDEHGRAVADFRLTWKIIDLSELVVDSETGLLVDPRRWS